MSRLRLSTKQSRRFLRDLERRASPPSFESPLSGLRYAKPLPVSVVECGVPPVRPEKWRACMERRFTSGRTARWWPRSHRCLTSVTGLGASRSTRAGCDGDVTNSDWRSSIVPWCAWEGAWQAL
jgi:hypothetical protein